MKTGAIGLILNSSVTIRDFEHTRKLRSIQKESREECPGLCEVCGIKLKRSYYIEDKWRCLTCHNFFHRKQKFKTQEEIEKLNFQRRE
jgi:hypothetical protein